MQTYVKQQYIVLNDLRDVEKGSIFVVQKRKRIQNTHNINWLISYLFLKAGLRK